MHRGHMQYHSTLTGQVLSRISIPYRHGHLTHLFQLLIPILEGTYLASIMACELCSNLVVDYRKLSQDTIEVPFLVEEIYPGLTRLARNAKGGCEFCNLLAQLISEYFDVTESGLEKPVHFQLRNAKFHTHSYEELMSEERSNSVENGVYLLVMELAYGDPVQTTDLYFSVCSNNDCECIIPIE